MDVDAMTTTLPNRQAYSMALPLLCEITTDPDLARISAALEGGLIKPSLSSEDSTIAVARLTYKIEEVRSQSSHFGGGKWHKAHGPLPEEQLRFYVQSQEVMRIIKESIHPGFRCHLTKANAPLLLIFELFEACHTRDKLQRLITLKERDLKYIGTPPESQDRLCEIWLLQAQLKSLKKLKSNTLPKR